MLEYPECISMARQLNSAVAGKIVSRVLPPSKEHKFCWFNGDPADYNEKIAGRRITAADGFGSFVELGFDNWNYLCFNDGVNVRLTSAGALPANYQLAILLDSGEALSFTVAMYGGIYLHEGSYDNEYYLKSKKAVSPLTADFVDYYRSRLEEAKESLSVKAFLATEQRFPGLGNGVLQDIAFDARLHPKRKLSTLDEADRERLLDSLKTVIKQMTLSGGRDTEKGLYGESGGYVTKMSKRALAGGCPVCGGEITKEAYLGGSVYYCQVCQSL